MHSGAPNSAGLSREETSTAIVGGQEGHRYDLLGTSALENPYPLYDELRVAAPVYRDRRFFGGILTRYDDVVAVLKDNRVSSRRPTADERVPRSLSAAGVRVELVTLVAASQGTRCRTSRRFRPISPDSLVPLPVSHQ